MFNPASILGKLFKFYLLLPSHPAKIRFESLIGKFLFPAGLRIKNIDGVMFKLDANDWITRTMMEQGCYEPESLELAKRVLSSGAVFVDIGANFGLFSCTVGKSNRNLKILSIEPNFQVLPILINNLKLNNLDQQAQIINVALSNKVQFMFLELAEKNNLGTTGTTLINNRGLSLLSCPLDYLLDSNKISVVDLIKIDIEGNEFSVLEKFPFEKYLIKNIIIEFNFLSKINFIDLKCFFERKGFTLFSIRGEKLIDDKMGIPENNIWIVNQKQTLHNNEGTISERADDSI